MEVVCFRFPHLGIQILENISDISFTECRKLSPSMCNFIDGTKSISRRILQTYLPDIMDVRKILRSSNSKTLEAFSYLVQDEFLRYGYNTSLVLELITSTGKSLSEALISASTNPQYDDRLFIELQDNTYKFQPQTWGEHDVYRYCF